MTRARSSISSSDKVIRGPGRRGLLGGLVGCLLTLTLFELAVAARFGMSESQAQPQGAIQRYFYYGESAEKKLKRSVGPEGQEPAQVVQAGWIKTELYPPPDSWTPEKIKVAVYGMSFTNRLAKALAQLDPSLSVMTRAGPGAPLNHAYGLFEADPHRASADVVVVGVLSRAVPMLSTLSGLSYSFESPTPFSYPMFTLRDDHLQRLDPPITTRAQFLDAFRSQSDLWKKQIALLKKHDAFWDSYAYDGSFLDSSSLVRLLRRAWHKKSRNDVVDHFYNAKDGYNLHEPAIRAVPALLKKMQAECATEKQLLIVVLLHALGEPGHLEKWLSADLKSEGIAVLSTRSLFDSTDSLNFLPDGHYLPTLDRKLGQATQQIIHAQKLSN